MGTMTVNKQLEPVLDIMNSLKCKKTFNRFQSDKYKRIKKSWRKPTGIDNRVRRKFRGAIKMPNKGYKNVEEFRQVMVANVKEIEAMTSLNNNYIAVIRHQIGVKKRVAIIQRAEELGINVANRNAKIAQEEEVQENE